MPELSPLYEIEQLVQARAKHRAIDVDSERGRAALRGLIDEAISSWRDEYRRGVRPYDLAGTDLVADRAYRNLAGYGPLEPLLEDDDVWEIMINAPDGILE